MHEHDLEWLLLYWAVGSSAVIFVLWRFAPRLLVPVLSAVSIATICILMGVSIYGLARGVPTHCDPDSPPAREIGGIKIAGC